MSAVISAANGITTTLHQEREINNIMLHNCEGKLHCAADPSSKIGRSHSFITCPIQDIDILVTLSTADEEEIRKIQDCGVQVILPISPTERMHSPPLYSHNKAPGRSLWLPAGGFFMH